MQRFIQKHAADVIGVLSGFDRMRFRGTLRWLANTKGMRSFLVAAHILLKDFKTYVTGVTEQIRAATTALAESEGRPVIYLDRPSLRKEDEARRIVQRDGITEGLICVLTSVEPCFSYDVGPNRETKRLELRGGCKKCLHQYFYFLDPQFGFMHARLQTWFPFTIHVCLNGREWLARQLDAAGSGYLRRENCFIDLADPARAQQLCDAQLKTRWKTVFHRVLRHIHPTHAKIFREHPIEYYWSLEESEWATHFLGEVVSDLKQRPEGLRIKHRVNHNSIKMYDKQGSVLRVETTINNTRDMKVFRRAEGCRQGPRTWRKLGRTIITAVLAARQANAEQLTKIAA